MQVQTREGKLLSTAPCMLLAAMKMGLHKLTIQGVFTITLTTAVTIEPTKQVLKTPKTIVLIGV
jgi:hypothetical protein